MPSGAISIEQLIAFLGMGPAARIKLALYPGTLQCLSYSRPIWSTTRARVETLLGSISRYARALAQVGPDPNNKIMMSAVRALERFSESQQYEKHVVSVLRRGCPNTG
jgi:hypothetical protein